MANSDFESDVRDICGPGRYGDDSTPWMAHVPEPTPSHWGKITSTPRTASLEYLKFLNRHKEVQNDRRSSG